MKRAAWMSATFTVVGGFLVLMLAEEPSVD